MDQPRPKEPGTNVAVGLSFFAILAAVAAYFVRFWGRPSGDTNDWALFGDYLNGVVAPIVSVATLVLVARTLRLQHNELTLAINELTRATKAHEQQAKIDERRSFDAKFVDQLSQFKQAVKAVKAADLVDEINERHIREGRYAGERKQPIEQIYSDYYGWHESELGPYYRLLFHLIKIVREADVLSEDEKRDYISLIRAHLGTFDLVLLLLNVTFHAEGREGLRPFVEEYGLLKHARNLKFPTVFVDARKVAWLRPSAFQSRAEMQSDVGGGGGGAPDDQEPQMV